LIGFGVTSSEYFELRVIFLKYKYGKIIVWINLTQYKKLHEIRLIFIRFVYFSVANIVYIDKQIVCGEL